MILPLLYYRPVKNDDTASPIPTKPYRHCVDLFPLFLLREIFFLSRACLACFSLSIWDIKTCEKKKTKTGI